MIRAIVAMDDSRCIGKDGGLPWHAKADLQRFRDLTMGGTVVMGRKTWNSIGRPLPGRRNVVLSRGASTTDVAGVVWVSDVDEAIAAALVDVNAWVIGGAEVYAAMLHVCTEILLTRVRGVYGGDVSMPPFEDRYSLVQLDVCQADSRLTFETWRAR